MHLTEISNYQSGLIENISISKIFNLMINGKEIKLRLKSIDEKTELELCNSIQRNGLLNPIIVRCKEADNYEVISGRRRIEAFKKLGLRKILCHVLDVDDKKAFEIALIENIQSVKINPIEEGIAFKNYVTEFGWGGISDLAKRISKSVTYVDRRIKLLNLSEEVKKDIIEGKLKSSLADELSSIKDSDEQLQYAKIIKEKSPSLRDLRNIIKRNKNNTNYSGLTEINQDNLVETKMIDIDEKTQRSFDQAIMTIRISMNKLSSIINNNEENWIVYETLMQHKNVLHEQIDILYKEKKKLRI